MKPPIPKKAWLWIAFSPGMCDNLTSWEVEIERGGYLLQTVHVHRPRVRAPQVEVYDATLTADQIAELERLVQAIDFAAIVADPGRSDFLDLETVCMLVDNDPQRFLRDSLLARHAVQSPPCPALADAIQLWNAVVKHLPCHPNNL